MRTLIKCILFGFVVLVIGAVLFCCLIIHAVNYGI